MTFSNIFKKGFINSYTNTEITFQYTVVVMLICLLISTVICAIYYFKSRKYFFSKEFAVSLVALSMITAAVILTIQSSIVVSLGMVGALSIVRFRTAIKNPLDLVFLFWAIVIGIICGAGLFFVAIPLTIILGLVILLSDELPGLPQNKLLVLNGDYPYDEAKLDKVLRKYAKWLNVKTVSVLNGKVNIIIELRAIKDYSLLIEELRKTNQFYDISLLEQKGTVD